MLKLLLSKPHLSLQAIDQVIYGICNVLTNMLIAKLIGPEQYGQYFAIWVFIFFLLELQTAFVDIPLLTIGPTYQEEVEAKRYYVGLFMVEVVWLLLSLIIIILWCSIFYHLSLLLACLFSFMAVLFMAQRGLRKFFQYDAQPKSLLKMDLISSGGQIMVLIGLFFFFPKPTLSQILLISGFTSLLGLATIIPFFSSWSFNISCFYQTFRRNFHFMAWYPIVNLLNMVYVQSMFKAIGNQLGKSQIGGLGVAQITMQPIVAVMANFDALYTPRFIRSYHHSPIPENRWKIYLRDYGILFAICTAYVVLMSYFAKPIILLFWGNAYLPYARFVSFQGIWTLLQLGCNLTGIYFFLIERPLLRTLSVLFTILLAWGSFWVFASKGLRDIGPYYLSQYVYLLLQMGLLIPLLCGLIRQSKSLPKVQREDIVC